jgi:hypothetical protein
MSLLGRLGDSIASRRQLPVPVRRALAAGAPAPHVPSRPGRPGPPGPRGWRPNDIRFMNLRLGPRSTPYLHVELPPVDRPPWPFCWCGAHWTDTPQGRRALARHRAKQLPACDEARRRHARERRQDRGAIIAADPELAEHQRAYDQETRDRAKRAALFRAADERQAS